MRTAPLTHAKGMSLKRACAREDLQSECFCHVLWRDGEMALACRISCCCARRLSRDDMLSCSLAIWSCSDAALPLCAILPILACFCSWFKTAADRAYSAS